MRLKRHTSTLLTLALISGIGLTAAVSPAFAAANLADADRGAIALVAAISLLLGAIVFEVWRLARKQQLPAPVQSRHAERKNRWR